MAECKEWTASVAECGDRRKTGESMAERQVRRKVVLEEQKKTVFFSCHLHDYEKCAAHWYSFDLNNHGDSNSSHKSTSDDSTRRLLYPCTSDSTRRLLYPCTSDDSTRRLLYPFASSTEQDGFDSTRQFSTVVSLNSVLYSLGGAENLFYLPLNYLFTFDTTNPAKGWVRGPNMHVARIEPKAVVVDGKIYVMGGTNFTRVLVDRNPSKWWTRVSVDPSKWAEVFDPLFGKWELLYESSLISLLCPPSSSETSKSTSSSNVEPISSLPDDSCFLSWAIGEHEICLYSSSSHAAHLYDVRNHSLKLLEDGEGHVFSFENCLNGVDPVGKMSSPVVVGNIKIGNPVVVGKTFYWLTGDFQRLVGYNAAADGKGWFSIPVEGWDTTNGFPPPYERTRPYPKGVLLGGSNSSSSGGGDYSLQLWLLWMAEVDDNSSHVCLHCTTIEVSTCLSSAFIKSSESCLVPTMTSIGAALLL